jgi:hypothetical protein
MPQRGREGSLSRRYGFDRVRPRGTAHRAARGAGRASPADHATLRPSGGLEVMMYYLVEFDPKPGVTQREVADAYRRFVEHYTKIFPQMKLEGLFARDMLLGTRPHYFALWEMPDYATLDAWKKAYAEDRDGARLTREINDMGVDWNAKIVKKLL